MNQEIEKFREMHNSCDVEKCALAALFKQIDDMRSALAEYHRSYGHMTTSEKHCICRDDSLCYAPIKPANPCEA